MKRLFLIAAIAAIAATSAHGQLTYTYTLDTVHAGGIVRVDSFYLVETVTGFLVNDGAIQPAFQGARSQTLETPLFFSDTAALTAFYTQLKNDSIALMQRADVLRTQALVAGAKYRAVWYVADSVFYGYTGGSRSLRLPPPEEAAPPEKQVPVDQPVTDGKKTEKKPKKKPAVKGRKKKQ